MTVLKPSTVRSWREAPLAGVFCVHFLLSSWSLLQGWAVNSLLIQDFFLLMCLLWAMHSRRDPHPVLLSMLVNLISVLLDIIVLSVNFPTRSNSTMKFSGVMAIFNLVFRGVTLWVLLRALDSRDELDGSPAVSHDSVVPVVGQQHHVTNEVRPASSNAGAVAQNNGVGEGYFVGSYQQQQGGGGPGTPTPSKPPLPPGYTMHN